MKGLNKLGKVITKILEVFHWVGAALMTAATVCSAVAPDWVKYFVGFDAKECCGVNLDVYGFEVNLPVANGNVDMTAFLIFGIGAVIILFVMAMYRWYIQRLFYVIRCVLSCSERNGICENHYLYSFF